MAEPKELTADNVKYLVVHCSDTYARMNTDAKEIDRWHRQRGFLRIGYHFVIRRNGVVQESPDCRATNVPGAHVDGYNSQSLGICMIGGKGDDNQPANNFTDDQFVSLAQVLSKLLVQFPRAEIVGHHTLNHTKACPCFDVKQWWHDTVAAPGVD